jgi:hypothetical protein
MALRLKDIKKSVGPKNETNECDLKNVQQQQELAQKEKKEEEEDKKNLRPWESFNDQIEIKSTMKRNSLLNSHEGDHEFDFDFDFEHELEKKMGPDFEALKNKRNKSKQVLGPQFEKTKFKDLISLYFDVLK